jgi:integration host factor subunit alpha
LARKFLSKMGNGMNGTIPTTLLLFPKNSDIYPRNQKHRPGGAAMTLVKENLIQSLCDHAGLSKQQSKALVHTTFELIKKALESGDNVLISGFGRFSARKKAPRKGRNPATGRDLVLDARRVVMFKCSPVLRDKINGAG